MTTAGILAIVAGSHIFALVVSYAIDQCMPATTIARGLVKMATGIAMVAVTVWAIQ